ncbi:MAG: NIL domain-containing protein [Cyanobacteria bacterium]|nr:NIL domain-containing protein [Cyanobacteriota bacterium]
MTFSANSSQPLTATEPTGDRRQTSHRIRIRVPQEHQSEPVISELVSRFGLTINIAAALLGKDGRGDGWFDLELRGPRDRILQAMDYLNDLAVEVWDRDSQEGW